MPHIEKRGKHWKVIIGGRASPKNFKTLGLAKKYVNKVYEEMEHMEKKRTKRKTRKARVSLFPKVDF